MDARAGIVSLEPRMKRPANDNAVTVRAEPARAPQPTRDTLSRRAAYDEAHREQTRREHFSLLRGLLWFAAIILVASIMRAGVHRAFVGGWWRQW